MPIALALLHRSCFIAEQIVQPPALVEPIHMVHVDDPEWNDDKSAVGSELCKNG